ncbi:hypothetical protein DFJ58DRAFT_843957 [Suillus subalutaceus]|uniref:uncharacterized protein n=1 Tax=Suillus subalutaceus TaxID=48586 RepID=UPI001B86B278|nr:uncharacterized protein DFJ58DRAFT_843957 [Suillus subalutaceus]KAG1844627.1 hypothetical protein DFJ58DRAFT_843957 [Suillus subalutaceus]
MDPAGESDLTNKCIYCRGVDTDSQPCNCEEFFTESQDMAHCVECGHGRSKHPRKVSGYTSENVQDEPRPSSSAAVKKIMDRITGASVNDKLVTTKQGSLPLTAAREEALSMLSSTRIASYNKLAKGPAPSTGLRKDHKETNPYPMNGFLRETKAPGKGGQKEIQAMRNHGCYLDQQFRIDNGWTYLTITRNLCTWFPKVFEYLDGQVDKRASQPPTREDKPIWRLLNKTGLLLTVVDVAFPTGSDLAKHKGRDKASVNDCHLWFVTRNQVPENVYESWNTQPIIAGSDSKHDCSDQLLSNTDSSVDDKSDNELTTARHSNLDPTFEEYFTEFSSCCVSHTDDEVKHSDSKGKMTAILPRGTNHMKRALSPDESPLDAKRVVQKKLKKDSCSSLHLFPIIPLFFMDSGSSSSQAPLSTQPTQSSSLQTASFRSQVPAAVLGLKNELSPPLEFVSVSKDDVVWRNKTEDDDPFAPECINPWDSCYMMIQNPATFLV